MQTNYWPSTAVIIWSITILLSTLLFFLFQMFSKALHIGAELSLFHVLLPSFMWCFPLFLACFTQIYYLNLILCNKIQQFLQHWTLLEESISKLIATCTTLTHSCSLKSLRNMKQIDIRVYWVIVALQVSLFSTAVYFITQSTMQCSDSFTLNPPPTHVDHNSTEFNANVDNKKLMVIPIPCADHEDETAPTYYSDATVTLNQLLGNHSGSSCNRLMFVFGFNSTVVNDDESSSTAIKKLFLMDYPQLNCRHYNCHLICYFYAFIHIASMLLVTVFVSLADLVPAFVYSHAATAAHSLRDFILHSHISCSPLKMNSKQDSANSYLTPTERHFFRIWLHYESIRVMVKRADSLFGLLVRKRFLSFFFYNFLKIRILIDYC